jgi:hypothetical protein
VTPSFVAFHDLKPGTHAITDGGSVSELINNASMLSQKLDPSMARTILNDWEGFGLEPALGLLERWIIVDYLVADVVAVDSLNHSQGAVKSFRHEPSTFYRPTLNSTDLARNREEAFLSHVTQVWNDNLPSLMSVAAEISLSFTLIPPAIFKKCVQTLGRTSQAIKAAHPEVTWANFGFGLEKGYGEFLVDFYGDASFLARSNFGVERTLFYYEIAATAGVPLVLHPDRNDETWAIDAACCDAYGSVKEVLRTAFEDPIRKELESLGQTHTVAVPPLVAKLIQIAGREGVSIIEAAAQIKDSKNARAFRKWLTEIQLHLAQGTTGGKVEALRMLDELRRVASLWTTYLDTTVGVTHKRRELRFSWVPRIGALLDLLDKPTVRDPILNRKGYLTFISSWFNDKRPSPGTR